MRFTDRIDAGRQLAERLQARPIEGDCVVLALPRGGVAVAEQVAMALGAPLDVLGVRKIGAPGRRELGVGAIAEGGASYLDEGMLARLGLTTDDLADVIDSEETELARRIARYRGDRPLPALDGKTVLIVDDGLATGGTARAAVRAARSLGAARVVVAIPVCAQGGRLALAGEADEVVCVSSPERFSAVGQWYDRFDQTSDDEVLAVLERSRSPRGER